MQVGEFIRIAAASNVSREAWLLEPEVGASSDWQYRAKILAVKATYADVC
jgi:hypothetical protein